MQAYLHNESGGGLYVFVVILVFVSYLSFCLHEVRNVVESKDSLWRSISIFIRSGCLDSARHDIVFVISTEVSKTNGTEKSPKAKHCNTICYTFLIMGFFGAGNALTQNYTKRSNTNNRDTIYKTVRYINTYIYLVYLFSNKIANILDIK